MDKKKVLITGASGQLGVDLVGQFKDKDYQVYGLSHSELDVTQESNVWQLMRDIAPDVVIHAGAYTKVDEAEANPDLAYRINGYGTRNIAVASEAIGAKLVYISTDYVFDGTGSVPYDEFAPVSPINVYGRSKWMGECFVEKNHSKFFIARTSWVYGQHGSNFVKTMMKLGSEQKNLSVVNDQIGCPTYTKDLATCVGSMIETERYGTYHISNTGQCSWYEFASAIFRISGMDIQLTPIGSDQFARPAKRPAYSVFDHRALRLSGYTSLRHWESALEEYLLEVKSRELNV